MTVTGTHFRRIATVSHTVDQGRLNPVLQRHNRSDFLSSQAENSFCQASKTPGERRVCLLGHKSWLDCGTTHNPS